jgi:hypothetical protein
MMRIAYVLVLLPALVGAVLGAVAYLAPVTGVDGTPGALLALVGAVLVMLGAVVAMVPAVRGWGLGLLNVLTGLGALLTAVAAYFLMQNAFAVAMAMTFLSLLLVLSIPNRRHA